MDRLTFEGNFCEIAMCQDTPGGSFCEDGYCSQRKCWERLKQYEDTGMEPEEILTAIDMAKIVCSLRALEAYRNLGSIDHIGDLLQAEHDGRLVVLPCKVGGTVYVIGEKRIMRCDIDEAYLDDKNGLEYLVSFGCDSDCTGCPFNSWRQDYSGEYCCDGEYGQASIMASDIGKTVFVTHEAAESALADTNVGNMEGRR